MTKRASLVIALVAVVVIGAWYVVLWRPAGSRLTSLRSEDAAAVAKGATLEGQLAHLETLERSLPAQDARLRRSLPSVPVAVSADTVIDQINAIAVADHITWTNESESTSSATTATTTPITTATSTTSGSSSGTSTTTTPVTVAPTGVVAGTGTVTSGGATTLALTIAVTGSYTEMRHFLVDLAQRPRLIVVNTLSYTPNGADVAVTVGADAFYDTSPLPSLPKAAA